MITHFTTAVFTILSVVAYQIGMKSVPAEHNPIGSLLTFYVTAFLVTLLAGKLLPVSTPNVTFIEFSWAAVVVGIAIVGIELGFLLMYRNNWNLATAPMVVMGASAVVLTPIALFVFKQAWSPRYLFGLVLCIWGLYLLAPQKS